MSGSGRLRWDRSMSAVVAFLRWLLRRFAGRLGFALLLIAALGLGAGGTYYLLLVDQPELAYGLFGGAGLAVLLLIWRGIFLVRDRRRNGPRAGSLTSRMILVSTIWILLLLGLGGYALDRVLVSAITSNFDSQLEYVLTAMIGSADIGPDGEVLFTRPLADQRFIEPYSGLYYQISGAGADPFPSRSLWDRRLRVVPHDDVEPHYYDSDEFPGEKLRIVERDVRLPNSPVNWRFQVAQSRDVLNEQIGVLRTTLFQSFAVLGLGLILLTSVQAIYGLWPLRRVRRAIAAIRSGRMSRVDVKLPREIEPMVEELNTLLAHNEVQA
jgi:hypothetical protein